MYFLALQLIFYAIRNIESMVVECNGVVFNGIYYDKQKLIQGFEAPYNLVLHDSSGELYFSHTTRGGTKVDFEITACHIDTRSNRDIHGCPGGYAIAYDHEEELIYFGGHNGIYAYNTQNKTADLVAEEGTSIWGLHIRNNFYYIEYPTQKVYVLEGDLFVSALNFDGIEIKTMFECNNSDIFYSNETALFKMETSKNTTIILSDNIDVKQIVEDRKGDVHFCASDGIYIEDKSNHTLKKLADIDRAFGMAFDRNGLLIYSTNDTIYRLRSSRYSKFCLKAIRDVEKEAINRKRFPPLASRVVL